MRISIVVALLASCGGDSKPVAAVQASAPAAPAASSDGVVVLAAGAEPRHVLRYRFAPKTTEYLEMDARMSLEMTMKDPTAGNVKRASTLPTFRSRIRIDIEDVTATGDARVLFLWEDVRSLGDVAIDAAARAQFDSELAAMVGTRARGQISPRGHQADVTFEFPPGMSKEAQARVEQLRDSFRQLSAILPEQPVGNGARWEVRLAMPTMGAKVDVTLRYHVNDLTPNVAKLGGEVEMAAGNQPMQVGGVTATLESLAAKGSGALEITFDRLVPTGQMKIANDARFTIENQGTLRASMRVEAAIAMRPAAR